MRYILGILICCIAFGCQDVKRPEKPENLIPKDRMVDILTETYLINAARSYDIKQIRKKKIKLDSFILKKYSIDSLQFARSNDFYTADLNTYNYLFEEVEKRLNLIKKRVDSIDELIQKQQAEKRRQDSIKGLNLDSIDALEKDTTNIFVKKPQLIDAMELETDQDSIE